MSRIQHSFAAFIYMNGEFPRSLALLPWQGRYHDHQEAWPGVMPTAFEGICFLSGMQVPLRWAREVADTLTENCGLQYPGDQCVPRSGPRLFRNRSLSILHPELIRVPLCKFTN